MRWRLDCAIKPRSIKLSVDLLSPPHHNSMQTYDLLGRIDQNKMPLDFRRSDEHRMLADSLARFAAEFNSFESRTRRLNAGPPDRLGLWRPLAELGLFAALVSEEQGGFGGTPEDMAVMQDGLAASLPVEPFLASPVICGRLLAAARSALLEDVITGGAIPILAHGEGFDPFAKARLTATAQSGHYRLDGLKPAVRHGDVATHFLVSADIDAAQRLFLVSAQAPGLTRKTIRLIDAAGAADVHFENVIVPAMAALSIEVCDAAIEDALEWGLTGLAVETASLIAAINAATFEYLGMRKQFGSRLADFQALQHKAADMAIGAEEAAAMAHLAVARLSEPATAERSAAILRASLACDSAGRFAAHTAIQLFGGMGVSDELIVSHYGRRLAAIRSQIGSMDARAARLCSLEGNG